MGQRIVILSDTHLGRPHNAARSAEALRPLWQGAEHLILNGDIAEIHHPSHWSRAARQTMRLYDLTEEDGVQLTLLSGNHDPYISDIRHLHLADGSIFVTHGDVLHPAVAPWSPAAGKMRAAGERALAAIPAHERDQLQARLRASQHASIAEWEQMRVEAGRSSMRAMLMRPWSIPQVLWYWRRIPGLAARFVKAHAPAASFMILGHTHRPGIWKIDGRTIINTGGYGFPSRARAVLIEERELSVRRIETRGAEYALSPRAIARFSLPDGPTSPGTSGRSAREPGPAPAPASH